MPHVVEPASSGRAKCRGCKLKIEKGALRLGVAVPNPFGEGESHHYYHLRCGALRRPDEFLELLARDAEVVQELRALAPTAELSRDHRRLRRIVRAEIAATGRARCRHCREMIDKGELRLALEIIQDGMPNAAGFVHVECVAAYVGTTEHVLELVAAQTPADLDLQPLRAELAKAGGGAG